MPDSGVTVIPSRSHCPPCRKLLYAPWSSHLLSPCLLHSPLGGAESTCLPRCCDWCTKSISYLQRTSRTHCPPCCRFLWGLCSSMPICLMTSSSVFLSPSSAPWFSLRLASFLSSRSCSPCRPPLFFPSSMS